MATRVVSATGLLLSLALGAQARLGAQESGLQSKADWDAGPVQGGWCVTFLLAPDQAAKDLARGYRPAVIGEVTGWHPALASFAADSQYAGWVPSRVCQVYVGALTYNGHRYDRGFHHAPAALAFWEVAVLPDGGKGGATGSARIFGINVGDLRQRMRDTFAPIEELQLRTDSVKNTRQTRYTVKMGKTEATLDGRSVPDSALTAGDLHFRLAAEGDRQTHWLIDLDFHPDTLTSLLGGLRFRGKGDLGKALQASPIRVIGSLFAGGQGTVTFSR
jgi:hypothetical protein